jgi:hypothetical protein
MALQSQLFRGDPKLEAAAVSDPAHILQGAKGPHVSKLQQALIQLDGAAIDPDGSYGPATARAVSAFKTKRRILNTQSKIDDIVGKKTMAALDGEMLAREGRGGGGARGGVRRGVNTVGDEPPNTPFGPLFPPVPALVVVPFPTNSTTEFILAQEFDDANSEDLRFSDPPFPPQTTAEKLITSAMEATELLSPFLPRATRRQIIMRAELAGASVALFSRDALRLVNFFVANPFTPSADSFGVVFGVGTDLSNSVRDTAEFRKEHEGIRSDIDKALKEQFLTGTIDFNKMKGTEQFNTKFKVPRFLGTKREQRLGVVEPARVGFKLGIQGTNGLAALIGDFQGCKVVLKSFDVDRSRNTYGATIQYQFVEHFGLDNSDVNPLSSAGHGTPGQICFWLLQHKSRPGHMPFRYLVIVEQEISGGLDDSISPPPGRGPSR